QVARAFFFCPFAPFVRRRAPPGRWPPARRRREVRAALVRWFEHGRLDTHLARRSRQATGIGAARLPLLALGGRLRSRLRGRARRGARLGGRLRRRRRSSWRR